MLKLGILASGRGSNFQAIIDATKNYLIWDASIRILITNNPEAKVIQKGKDNKIKYKIIEATKSSFEFYEKITSELLDSKVDLVILAGFMMIIKDPLLSEYKQRIMNIHPSLLPSFPGLNAQKQAFEYGVKVTGCTVHFVDEGIDTGPIILQSPVPVMSNDTVDSLSERILEKEHIIFSEAIRLYSEELRKFIDYLGYEIIETNKQYNIYKDEELIVSNCCSQESAKRYVKTIC